MEDFLATKEFARSSPDTFSNGYATLQFDGDKFTASPGSGGRVWSSDFGMRLKTHAAANVNHSKLHLGSHCLAVFIPKMPVGLHCQCATVLMA